MSEYTGCDKCKFNTRADDEFPCSRCEHNATDHYKPMTNADRIRNMNDRELAEFLVKVNTAYAEPCMISGGDCKWEDYPTHDKGCKDCFFGMATSRSGRRCGMIVNIVIPVIVLAIIIFAYSMCKSASDYDDISEEYWNEYWEEEDNADT